MKKGKSEPLAFAREKPGIQAVSSRDDFLFFVKEDELFMRGVHSCGTGPEEKTKAGAAGDQKALVTPLPERLFRLGGNNVHPGEHPFFADIFFKLHNSVASRENGEIPTQADAAARMHLRAELTHDNIARKHGLTAETLHAPALARAVAAVAGTAARFFMCHGGRSSANAVYAEMDVILMVV